MDIRISIKPSNKSPQGEGEGKSIEATTSVKVLTSLDQGPLFVDFYSHGKLPKGCAGTGKAPSRSDTRASHLSSYLEQRKTHDKMEPVLFPKRITRLWLIIKNPRMTMHQCIMRSPWDLVARSRHRDRTSARGRRDQTSKFPIVIVPTVKATTKHHPYLDGKYVYKYQPFRVKLG